MNRHARLLLICGLSSAALGCAPHQSRVEQGRHVDSQPRWTCFVADDALERKQQVERGMLPIVVFTGEDQPGSVEARMYKNKVPALSVAAIHNGELDWSAAWGELQVGGAHADCGSLFQAGSLAKPVTLLAAFRMKQKGLIEFDRDIETYLKSYHLPAGRQSDTNPITFRNLFAHTSGITPGGYIGYAQGQPLPSDQETVRADAPSNARKVEVLTTPGTSLAYSGGGYTVAEIALQDRFDKSFAQLMREWLLAPVGMLQADFTQPLPSTSHEFAAKGYRADGSAVPGGWHNHPEQAAAGLWATARDMAAFLIEIRKGYRGESEVFTQASIRELLAEPVDEHAYGFRLIGEGDQMFITHYGGTVGYNVGMTLNLTTGDGAVFMSNSESMILGQEFLNAMSRVYGWQMFREVQVSRATQPANVLQSITGQYIFAEQGWKVSVVYENQALTLVFPNGDRYAMAPIQGEPLEFIHPDTAVRASFHGEGTDMRIQLYGQTGLRQASK